MSNALLAPRIRVPRSAKAGEVIEIRTLMEHPMETGLRQDDDGFIVPRNMLTSLLVRMNGETVLAAEFRNGTAANPYHAFFVRVEQTSLFEFAWTDEFNRTVRAEARVAVA